MNKKTIVNIFFNPLFLIVLTGLVFRLIAWHNTCAVNPDAAVYIDQAKAIYNNNYSAILTRLNFLSIYSICIALTFPLFSNWILTATFISIFFGTITIIPLYFFLKQYLNRQYALMTTLIVAVLPVFVSRSVDIIKDPMYWFFLTSGLYFFVRQIEGKGRKWGIASFILFSLATLVRIEAVIVLAVSLVFFIFCNRGKKYLSGLIVLFSFVWISFVLNIQFSKIVFNKFFRFDFITDLTSNFYYNYHTLRMQVKDLALQQPLKTQLFLLDARRDIWLIGFEKFFNSFLEGVAYIPGFLCLTGILTFSISRINKKFAYCLSVMSAGFCALYVFNLNTWILSYRYVILFIIPSSVFMGLGLKKCCLYAEQKWHISQIKVMVILVAIVLIVAFVKDLKPRRAKQVIINTSSVHLPIQSIEIKNRLKT